MFVDANRLDYVTALVQQHLFHNMRAYTVTFIKPVYTFAPEAESNL